MKCVNCKYWNFTFCSTGVYDKIDEQMVIKMGIGCNYGSPKHTNKEEDGELKLFVWDSVHNDYTNGYAIAVAVTKEEAIKSIAENSESYQKELYLGELYNKEPKIYTKFKNELPFGFWIKGGA